ncbi:hypothetical protein NE237_000498 [Protea cynaroides]|uniref:F-box protein n=1 Tax=Protea cynaroides TaxID=273540 RepID=A0A9Q0KRK2_9MAGN|nr:hypothetical protein NE237_000498 [Protea cynaroides]
MRNGYTNTTGNQTQPEINHTTMEDRPLSDSKVIAQLYYVKEIAADRAEMHTNIGEQRNNWNHLLLMSVNAMTLTAATMAGFAATSCGKGAPLLAFKFSSTLLYTAATVMLMVMNKIHPSQLAEEQRNAVRLFKQIHREIQTILAIGNPTERDVKDAMDKILALDRAYPLPLLGAMLDKFPATVEPAMWWPQRKGLVVGIDIERRDRKGSNGWNVEMEEEMRQIGGVLKRKDKTEYVRLSKLVLKVHKILAISGPLLMGIAAVGSALQGPWAVVLGIIGGALATIVNTMEHGGQVGMVFEMYRSTAGFFRFVEESILSTLKERDVEKRENGEFFEMKVALQLGRSLSELRNLAAAAASFRRNGENTEEFASKLF